MSELLQVESTITKVSTMADRSLRLQVDTQELAPEDAAKVFSYYQTFGVFAFSVSEEGINPEEINVPEYAKIEKSDKSPSIRLRAVLYRVWEQSERKGSSDDFYRTTMEKIINHYKSQLE